jgi:cystathionine beta-lyase
MVFLPGVILGFHRVCRMAAQPDGGVLVQPPVYPPILHAAAYNGLEPAESDLTRTMSGGYEIDFAAFESAITERTRVFLLCNPHNPVGRTFQAHELERLAEICLRRGVLICSDEIHCDILFDDARHIPIASLAPEIARRTVTLIAPSKTFNIPGLHCSVAIVQDPDLRRQFRRAGPPHSPQVNTLGFVAALAAYKSGGEWLRQALRYLGENRDLVAEFAAAELPGIAFHRPEATYLAWLDCRKSGVPGDPYRFFLEKAKVALSPGPSYGKAGEGFVRLNFGCPRSTLREALERMRSALENR